MVVHLLPPISEFSGTCSMATGSDDTTIRIWDCDTGMVVCKILLFHTVALINIMLLTPFPLCIGKCSRVLTGHTGSVVALSVLPDGWLLSGGDRIDGTIRVWDHDKGIILYPILPCYFV